MIPAGENQLSALANDPQRLIRVPVGFVSPFWGLFAGAAMSGAAWWWMTRWARPANLEEAFGAAEAAVTETEAKVEALTAPVMETIQEPAETIEVAVEDAPPVPPTDVVIEAAPEPVGGESAPISPVVAAESPQAEAPAPEAEAPAKPAARPKKAANQAD